MTCGVDGCWHRAAPEDVICADHAILATHRAMATLHRIGSREGRSLAHNADEQWCRCRRRGLPVPPRELPAFGRLEATR